MNKPTWAPDRGQPLPGRFASCQSGESLVGFAMVLPMLLLMTLGTLEFMLAMFDYHRAGDATRRAARAVAVTDSMVAQDDLLAAGQITCASNGTTVTCNGQAPLSAAPFAQALQDAQGIFPDVSAEHLRITYINSGVGDPTTPGGIIPVVTAHLENLQHDYMMVSGLPGFGTGYTFQPMAASRMGRGMGSAAGGV